MIHNIHQSLITIVLYSDTYYQNNNLSLYNCMYHYSFCFYCRRIGCQQICTIQVYSQSADIHINTGEDWDADNVCASNCSLPSTAILQYPEYTEGNTKGWIHCVVQGKISALQAKRFETVSSQVIIISTAFYFLAS